MSSNALEKLEKVIESRKSADPDKSYVAKLLKRGRKKMAQKVAEEGAEVAIAAVSEGRKDVIAESADLLVHLMVLWSDMDIRLNDVAKELKSREGISGLEEKAKRKKG